MKKGYEEYQVNQVATANPKQLVIMLYEGAIRFLEEALQNIGNFRKYDVVNTKILRAQDIINELMVSLDMEKGGEIANNLLSLYVFMKKELLEANINKDKTRVERVIKMLVDLKSAWENMDPHASLADIPSPKTEEEVKKAGFVARG